MSGEVKEKIGWAKQQYLHLILVKRGCITATKMKVKRLIMNECKLQNFLFIKWTVNHS